MAEREIDREIDRKKKEQESAEAISGLKNLHGFLIHKMIKYSIF